VANIEACLDPNLPPKDPRVRPIEFLREYSNYLTPTLGLLGVDTWTMIAIWLRNCFLNLLILGTSGAAILLLPLLLFRVYDILTKTVSGRVLGAGSIILFLFSGIFVALNLRWFTEQPNNAFYTQPKWIRRLIVVPTFASAFVLSALCWKSVLPASQTENALAFGAILFSYLLLIQTLAGFYDCSRQNLRSDASPLRRFGTHVLYIVLFLLFPGVAGIGVGSSVMLVYGIQSVRSMTVAREWSAMSWGTITLVGIFALVVTIHVGLMGRNLPDDRREWWGRLSAWIFIYAIVFVAVAGLSFWGPAEERNHQGKENLILFPLKPLKREGARNRRAAVRCRERLGGLLKYYEREAA
jgi:hypothetical protein